MVGIHPINIYSDMFQRIRRCVDGTAVSQCHSLDELYITDYTAIDSPNSYAKEQTIPLPQYHFNPDQDDLSHTGLTTVNSVVIESEDWHC